MKTKHEIEKIKWNVIPIVNYKGCLLEKLNDGYKILGQIVSTPEEVDIVLNEAILAFEKNIKCNTEN